MKTSNTFLNTRQNQLTSILQAWNKLDSEKQKATINLVVPLIQSASLLNAISPNKSLNSQLELFQRAYQTNHKADISQLGSSDFSADLMQILIAIKEIDNSKQSLQDKRLKVLEIFQKHPTIKSLEEFREKLKKSADHKYQNAHARISYNYGKFVRKISQADRGRLNRLPRGACKRGDALGCCERDRDERLPLALTW